MPLTKLEYTSNIEIPNNILTDFFKDLHVSMVEMIGTDLETCKASASSLDHYFMKEYP